MPKLRAATGNISAAGRLLDPRVCEGATALPSSPPRQTPTRRTVFRKRQVILDDAAHERFERLTAALRRATGTRLTASHALRALLALTDPMIDRIGVTAPPAEAMFLPNNAARFDGDRRRFELALTGIIRSAWPMSRG